MEINYEKLKNIPDAIMIDIRESDDYNKNHLSNTINIPFTKLLINMQEYLQKDKAYVLLCEYGIKSKKTSIILNKNGFQTFSLKGGIRKIR